MWNEGDEIRRTVTLTEQDVIAANRFLAQRLRLCGGGWFYPIVTGFIGGAIWLIENETTSNAGYPLVVGLAAAFAVYLFGWAVEFVSLPSAARRAWRESPGLRRPTDYVLGADRISYLQENASGRMALGELAQWSADERYLLLFNTRMTFYILPKSAFSDEELSRIWSWLDQAGVQRF